MSWFLDVTIGGERLRVTGIELFPSPMVAEWRSVLAEGQQLLGGDASSGVGFWGSPGWVLTGSVILGVMEKSASVKRAKDGLAALRRANALLAKTRKRGKFLPIEQIANVNLADPAMWEAEGETSYEVTLEGMPWLDKQSFLSKHGLTRHDVHNGVAHVTGRTHFVSLGQDFVRVGLASRQTVQVRWSAVNTFELKDAGDGGQ